MAYIDDVYLVVNIAPVGIPTYVRLSQNENGRKLYFAVTGGEIPSGSTATMSGTKPDGVVYSKAGSISGNTVTFNEDIQLTAVAGEWPAKIVIVNGGQTVMTARIRFVIDADTVAAGAVPSDSQLEGLVAQAAAYAEAAKDGAFYGSPLVASTVAEMTDQTRVYVYTGSESGYTAGNWYYWNGSAWTSGGVYNATAVSTDTTLIIAGKAADAKATGDAIRAVTIPTDKTLTQSDKPADAKVVGDELADLKDELNESVFIVGDTHSPIEWEQGTLYAAGGGKRDSTINIRTNAFSKGDIFSIYPSAGYMIELAAYDAENQNAYVGMWQGDTFNKAVKYFSSGIIMRNMPETYLYKIVLKSSEEEEIDPTYYINCNIKKESYVLKTDFDPSIANNAYNMAQSIQEGLLPRLNFGLGNIGSSGNKISSTTVCCSKTAVKFDRDTFIRCVSSEYLYTLRRYSGEEINASNYIDYLGSFYGTYKLNAGTYYVIAIAKRTPETITDVDEYAQKIEVWSPMYLEEMRKYELDRFAPFGNTRRKIYAHKGITLHEPENTVPSFEAAGIGGAWAIETDIQATSDGHLICMHDMTVDRTTTGTGTIANMTFAEIEELRIKDHPDLKVPTVEQYLEICKIYGCVPCMELKNVASSQEMITKLLQTITDYGLESTAVILCSTYSIGYVQCINHKIRCIFIIDPTDLETWIPRAQRYFNVSVTMASGTYTVTHEIIKQLHDAGLVVNVGGVNTVEEIKRYFAMGADSVSSDFIATY